MKAQQKKPKRARRKIDWQSLLLQALIDLVVGTLLIIIGKLIG